MTEDHSTLLHEDFAHLEWLIGELSAIRADIIELERREASRVSEMPDSQQASARNLLHCLALRRLDLRPLQEQLARLGLSSLGRTESHVLTTVNTVLDVLRRVQAPPAARISIARAGVRRGDRPPRRAHRGLAGNGAARAGGPDHGDDAE